MANSSRDIPNQNQRTLSTTTTVCSTFVRTLCLHDWWLIKAERDSKGRRLGVGGFASRESQGIRVFHSAAIAKRHDTVTLETVDGITIRISGFINRSLTHQNGFPSEVCNHFLYGFPYQWEDYVARCFGEEFTTTAVPSRISSLDGSNMSPDDGTKSFLPVSLDDLPVTRIRDILMSTPGDSENCAVTKSIFNDLLQKCCSSAFQHTRSSVHSNKETDSRVMTGDSILDETPSNPKRTKVKQKYKDDTVVSDTPCARDVHSLSKGVATRSMTRSKNLRDKQEENLSPNASGKHGISEPFSVSDASRDQCGGIVIRRNALNVSHATIISERETEVRETTDKSAVRRSRRLKNTRDPFSTSEASGNQCEGMKTRLNASNVRQSNIGETEVEEIPNKSSVRRSKRLKNLQK